MAAKGNCDIRLTSLSVWARTAAAKFIIAAAAFELSGNKKAANRPDGTTPKPIIGTKRQLERIPISETWLK